MVCMDARHSPLQPELGLRVATILAAMILQLLWFTCEIHPLVSKLLERVFATLSSVLTCFDHSADREPVVTDRRIADLNAVSKVRVAFAWMGNSHHLKSQQPAWISFRLANDFSHVFSFPTKQAHKKQPIAS